MSRNRTCNSLIRIALFLFTLGSAADALALLMLPATQNGNDVMPGLASNPNELSFAVRFNTLQSLQFDVLVESSDDPSSPIALIGLIENLTVVPWAGLTMTLGGGATLTGIGDAMPTALVNAFPRGTVAEFAFEPPFAVNAFGLIGQTDPWLINTHGAETFSISFSPIARPQSASVPEPATFALMLIALAGLCGARRHREAAAIAI